MEGWDKKKLRRVHGTPVHVIVYKLVFRNVSKE